MKKTILLSILIFIGLNCFADDAHGWIDPILGSFEIQESHAIEMTDEVVEIWENHVKVQFHFTNLTDYDQTVTVGFPVIWEEETGVGVDNNQPLDDSEANRKKIENFYKFKSTCNGKPLERKLIANARNNPKEYEDKCDFWFVTELTFKPHEVLEVIDEYNHGASGYADGIGHGEKSWTYVLSTGSSWAKVIKKATIIFHSTSKYWTTYNLHHSIWNLDEMSYKQCFSSYKPVSIIYDKTKKESVITWILENIEPKKEWTAGIVTAGYITPLEDSNAYSVIVNLLWDELIKIPEYKEVLENKGFDRTVNYTLEYIVQDVIPKMSAKEFYDDIVVFTYESAFTEFQPKTKVAATYAQFLINSIYALHGYKFKDEKWTNIFSRFSWYKPATSSISEKDFSPEEQKIINHLKKYR